MLSSFSLAIEGEVLGSIGHKEALALLAATDAELDSIRARALANGDDAAWQPLWAAYGAAIMSGLLKEPTERLSLIFERLEHLAHHGDQAVLDAVCIECIERFVEHIRHDEKLLISLLRRLGPRCQAYAIAWATSG